MNSAQPPLNSKFLPWLVVITAASYFFYDFIQLNLFNSINIQMMESFNLNAVQLGSLSSMFFYAEVLFLIPAGLLLDRFSAKILLLFAVFCSTLGTLIFAIAPSYAIAACARFLVGLGGTFCFLGSVRIATRWFPANKMAFVTGVIVTLAMLGGVVAQAPMTMLVHAVGWRHAVLIDACLGVVVFLAVLSIVKDYPTHEIEASSSSRISPNQSSFKQDIKAVVSNPYNWLCGLYASLLNLPVFLLGALWSIRYLVQVHHFPIVQASIPPSLFFVGVIIGAPAFGWFSDRVGRRILPLKIGAILSLSVILVLMFIPHLSFSAVTGLFFLMGFVICSQVIVYPLVAELNPAAITATAVGLSSTVIMCSGAIFQPLFGWIMERNSVHQIVNGVAQYTAMDFLHAMAIMPIAFIIGLLIATMLKETYCDNDL